MKNPTFKSLTFSNGYTFMYALLCVLLQTVLCGPMTYKDTDLIQLNRFLDKGYGKQIDQSNIDFGEISDQVQRLLASSDDALRAFGLKQDDDVSQAVLKEVGRYSNLITGDGAALVYDGSTDTEHAHDSGKRRMKRDAIELTWPQGDVTWAIEADGYWDDASMPPAKQEEIFANAFAFWHEALPCLNFVHDTENPTSADIQIKFVCGAHGDYEDFDGEGNKFAHAFFPQNGDMHFDCDEEWLEEVAESGHGGLTLYSVAVHEIGHAIGLTFHSVDINSVMYDVPQPVPGLITEDTDRLDVIYPDCEAVTTTTSTTATSTTATSTTTTSTAYAMTTPSVGITTSAASTTTTTSSTTTTSPTTTSTGTRSTTTTPTYTMTPTQEVTNSSSIPLQFPIYKCLAVIVAWFLRFSL